MSGKINKIGKIVARANKLYALEFYILIVASIRKVQKKEIRLELAAAIDMSDFALKKYVEADRSVNLDLNYTKAVAAAEYFDKQIAGLDIVPDDLYLPTGNDDTTPNPEVSPERLGLSK